MAIAREWRRGRGRGWSNAGFWEDEGRKEGNSFDGPGIGRRRSVGLGLRRQGLGLGLRLRGLRGRLVGWLWRLLRLRRRTLLALTGEKGEAVEERHLSTDLS